MDYYLSVSELHCMATITIGLSFIINSVWILVLVTVAIYTLQKFCIEREEKYLEEKFGNQYIEYKKQVRRWL